MRKKLIKIADDCLYLKVSSYQSNGRLYLGIVTRNNYIYSNITKNVKLKFNLDENMIVLSNDISDGLKMFLMEKRIISDIIKIIEINGIKYELVKVNFKILQEYDEDGLKNYCNYYSSLNKYKKSGNDINIISI